MAVALMGGVRAGHSQGAGWQAPAAWRESAQHSRVKKPGDILAAEDRLGRLPAAQRDAVVGRLTALLAHPATAQGVQAAARELKAAVKDVELGAQDHESSGTPPTRAAMLECGLLILHGLVARAGSSAAQARDVKAAAAIIKAVKPLNQDTGLIPSGILEEARVALGDGLYAEARKAKG